MKKYSQKMSSFIVAVVLVCAILPFRAEASYEIPGICQVQTDTNAAGVVKTLDYGYTNNTYISLRDAAMILKDTDKVFSLEITKNAVSMNLGTAYTPVGAENAPWESSENPDLALRRNEFQVNGQKVYYYTMICALPSGGYDCFIMAADLAMILDADIVVPSTGGLQINTQTPFAVAPAVLEQAGYFYGVNSVLAGDATTGEIYYQYQSDTAYPIASTSKLMTCLLTMEAIAAGQIAADQTVFVSETAQALSVSGDGVIPFEAGQQITVQELLLGALLPSSNECALCLAETIDGSEEAFVRRMNQKAQDLGLSQAVFYNSHGLPAFTQDPVPSKRQNRMSAKDMFRMVSYLLKVYPQIKEITSLQEATLPSLNLEVRNLNPLLRNMSQVTGLKTGTTNKSGACLVTSLAADDGVLTHDLV
ncbi:MAG: serine hydrolase, partial [Lachnospiraceae bacterium]|nr:serine hydrolase [Lachnospiraceae bacterium]